MELLFKVGATIFFFLFFPILLSCKSAKEQMFGVGAFKKSNSHLKECFILGENEKRYLTLSDIVQLWIFLMKVFMSKFITLHNFDFLSLTKELFGELDLKAA